MVFEMNLLGLLLVIFEMALAHEVIMKNVGASFNLEKGKYLTKNGVITTKMYDTLQFKVSYSLNFDTYSSLSFPIIRMS